MTVDIFSEYYDSIQNESNPEEIIVGSLINIILGNNILRINGLITTISLEAFSQFYESFDSKDQQPRIKKFEEHLEHFGWKWWKSIDFDSFEIFIKIFKLDPHRADKQEEIQNFVSQLKLKNNPTQYALAISVLDQYDQIDSKDLLEILVNLQK